MASPKAKAAAKKKSTAKKTRQTVKTTPAITAPPRRVSSSLKLLKQSLALLRTNWRLFGGIAAVYAVLNLIFVSGGAVNVLPASAENAGKLTNGVSSYSQLLSSAASAPNDAAGAYQLFLGLLFSLATIWTLRQVLAGRTVRIRDAFYRGMYPLVPFILLIFVVGLQLIPMLLGIGLYQSVVTQGIAVGAVEILLWLLFAFGMSLLSLYFAISTLLALVIVTLPDVTPRQALQLAKKVVRGRRWLVLRKLLPLPFVLGILTTVIVLPVFILLPGVASWLVVLIGPIMIVIAHCYFYMLYRELVGE